MGPLPLFAAEVRAGRGPVGKVAMLVVILGGVAKRAVIVSAFEKNAVLRRKLHLGFGGDRELLEIVVHAPPPFRTILCIDGVGDIIESAVLGASFQPVAVAQELRIRTYAKMVLFEESRVGLLRIVFRKVAGSRRREEIKQQQFAGPRRLVTKVDPPRIAQGVITIGQKLMGRE